MRYLLINDTSSTNNPGCQATVAALKQSYQRAGAELVGRVELGEGYHCFSPLTKSLQKIAGGTIATAIAAETTA